ncbi:MULTISPECIES: hypothetical protein [unclassified Sphingomonas]|uniref:hypothetical protein n=1 Tax=unclassified Sphingomonas TaxID=196159 RepID=UPI00226AEB53|nr:MULTISPECIES: hypothetical protein [unclassified Sphingomonas]
MADPFQTLQQHQHICRHRQVTEYPAQGVTHHIGAAGLADDEVAAAGLSLDVRVVGHAVRTINATKRFVA